MRVVTLGLLLAACGGGAKTAEPADTAKAEPAMSNVYGPAELAGGDGKVVVEEPPPPKGPPIWERIRVTAGPVPGLEAFSVELEDSRTHCGGTRLITTRNKKKKIAKTDQALADYFAVEYPLGLDFTEGEKAKQSMATFDTWLSKYVELGKTANTQYEGELLSAKDGAGKVAAAARIAQLRYRFSSVLAYAEIPVDVRSGKFAAEATEAFCGRMAEVAEPLLARADEAVRICAEKAQSVTVKKSVWWQQVCVVPAS